MSTSDLWPRPFRLALPGFAPMDRNAEMSANPAEVLRPNAVNLGVNP